MPTIYDHHQAYQACNGETLRDVLIRENISPPSPCGGRGTCGKCRVLIEEEGGKRSLVRACQYPIQNNLRIIQHLQSASDIVCRHTGEIPEGANLGYALDLGTTTLCACLFDLDDGSVYAESQISNPLSTLGADVLTRLTMVQSEKMSSEEAAEILRRSISRQIYAMTASPDRIQATAISANSAMRCLLLGQDSDPLTRPPFDLPDHQAHRLPGSFLGLSSDVPVDILPIIDGFAGADTLSALFCRQFDRDENQLLIDIGTNTEIALRAGEQIYVCTCPSGPAFEGANISCGSMALPGAISSVRTNGLLFRFETIGKKEACSICGSGLIDLCAGLLKTGLLLPDGRINDPELLIAPLAQRIFSYREESAEGTGEGERALSKSPEEKAVLLTSDVFVTQKDIRALQLAKGAIRAGIERLMTEAGGAVKPLKITLTGAFGQHLNLQAAVQIGLIPESILPADKACIHLVENASLSGTREYLLKKNADQIHGDLLRHIRYISLSEDPMYQDLLMQLLKFSRKQTR